MSQINTAIGTLTCELVPNSHTLNCRVRSGIHFPNTTPAIMHSPTQSDRYRSNNPMRFVEVWQITFIGSTGSFTANRFHLARAVEILTKEFDVREATLHTPHQSFMNAVSCGCEGIHYPLALSSFHDEPRSTKIREMPGDCRLRQSNHLLKFADTLFLHRQQIQYPQARLARERFE